MATLTQDVKQLVQEKLLIEIVLSFLKVMQRLHYTLHWLKKVISLKKNF